jgi:hypothetical protein
VDEELPESLAAGFAESPLLPFELFDSEPFPSDEEPVPSEEDDESLEAPSFSFFEELLAVEARLSVL